MVFLHYLKRTSKDAFHVCNRQYLQNTSNLRILLHSKSYSRQQTEGSILPVVQAERLVVYISNFLNYHRL